MKGLRGLFRLGTLTLLALTLMVAMALPSAAADKCSTTQMLDEVEIVSVMAKEAQVSWSAQDLVNFDYDGDIENGLLEVVFKDIPTDFDFDGYVIKAEPGNNDPGNSDDLLGDDGDYMSDGLIARPAVVGSTITEVLNLEPGTKYYVTVYAVNHNTVQISPDQRAQDSSSATTLLSAPFLGALEWEDVVARRNAADDADQDNFGTLCSSLAATTGVNGCDPAIKGWSDVGLEDTEFQGAHFGFYDADNEAGQHYFRWLNPAEYGPFDHIRDAKDGKQADMLSFDKDGNVEDHCTGSAFTDGDCGHTHYQFKAVDENGNTVASELVETMGDFMRSRKDYFQTVFTAESGDLTLSVSLGRKVGGKYKAMSDTASVMFEAPGDLRALDQTYLEYLEVNGDIAEGVKETGDIERYLDSLFNARSHIDEDERFKNNAQTKSADPNEKLVAYLNNQLK